MNEKQEYNLILKSNSGDGTVGNKEYFFDFNLIPEGQYEVTYSFMSLNSIIQNLNFFLYISLGATNNYEINLNSYPTTTNFLGGLCQYFPNTNYKCFFQEYNKTNSLLINRPTDNFINVKFVSFGGGELNSINSYILHLTLKRC
jgi:hypothetical protein